MMNDQRTTIGESARPRVRSLRSLRSTAALGLLAIGFLACPDPDNSGSVPPFAAFSVNQVPGTQTVVFEADADDAEYEFEWDWGDGNTDPPPAGDTLVHTFCEPGDYEVELTVSGPLGDASHTKTVTVDAALGSSGDACDRGEVEVWYDSRMTACNGMQADAVFTKFDSASMGADEDIQFDEVVDRTLSPCNCFGVKLVDPLDSADRFDFPVRIVHVDENGSRSELCEEGEPLGLGFVGADGKAGHPDQFACDTGGNDDHYNSDGIHTITISPIESPDVVGGGYSPEECDEARPTGPSFIRQFKIE